MDERTNDALNVSAEKTGQPNAPQPPAPPYAPQNPYSPYAPPPRVYPAPPPKPLFTLEKGDTAFAVCAVAVSVFAAVFGLFGGYALGYGIACLLMTGLFAAYFAKGAAARPLPVLCGALSAALAAVFVCTTNGSVRFFGAIVSFLLGLVCFDGLVNGAARGNRETLGVFYSAGATMGNAGVAVKSLFVSGDGKNRVVGKALIGLACAVPALVVIVPLLRSSDDAFRGMLDNLFGNFIANGFKAAFGLVLSLFVVAYGFSLNKGRVTRAKQADLPGIDNVYIVSFLSAIGVCYLLYLFSQLAYFFSAFSGFLPNGQITYAEYARKGFFEMCVIAVINLVIVFLALLLAKKQAGRVCHTVKALATFVAAFTLMIIATAISKMVLYIGAYGMTVLRLTTSAFMLLLAVVFVSVILRIFLTRINIVKTALLTAGCILLVLGTANVNAVCARYNYESYVSGKLRTIDVDALYRLGDEGVPYLVKLADDQDSAVSAVARKRLAQAVVHDYFDGVNELPGFTADSLKGREKEKGFERFSLPKAAAYDSLYAFIAQNPAFADECRELLSPGANAR